MPKLCNAALKGLKERRSNRRTSKQMWVINELAEYQTFDSLRPEPEEVEFSSRNIPKVG